MTATECHYPQPFSEYVILVDDQDRQIGLAEKLEAHQKNWLHRAFSAFIFRKQPRLEILMQQRALHKYHSPGLWTNTCCSHPRMGESVIDAGQRRLQEEMGVTVILKEVGWFQYNAHFSNGLSEHEIDHVLVGEAQNDMAVHPNPGEVHAYQWMTVEDLEQDLANYPEKYTQWLGQALKMAKTGLRF